MVNIEQLRQVNESGTPLAKTTIAELLTELENTRQELANERVVTMAAATIFHNVGEVVADQAVQDLHESLLHHIMADREGAGYTTQESIAGYSEGAEYGTISLASRIKTILEGKS